MAKTIMIVDDSASIRQVVSIALKGAGYEVLEASDGKQALALCEQQKVHLVVCDVNMPVMDGITFVKELKARPMSKFTPVIMLTTEAGDAKKQAGQQAGAKAWIVKPFQPAQLLDAVAKLSLP
ncbi:response regulator [Thiorhodospira sibirica]|uniref:response regulator n=1 Tax=Thiorhodospira sibirica TaxID=154347 RepID=UPI00022C229D|nr:response regulator [Thiorhodospira sibirica]